MKSMFARLNALVALMLVLNCVQAQPGSGIETLPGWPEDQPAELNGEWVKSISDLLDEDNVKQIIQDTNSRASVASQIESKSDFINQDLQWTGAEGYLIRIKMQKATGSGQVWPLGAPEFIGSGQNPHAVLAAHYADNTLVRPPDPGNVADPDSTTYVWATVRPGIFGYKRLMYTLITPPTAFLVTQRAMLLASDQKFLAVIGEVNANVALENAVKKMGEQATDATIKARYISALQSIKEAETKISTIDAQLATTLQRQHDAQGMLGTLNALKGILSFAELLDQAKFLFPTDTQVWRATSVKDLVDAIQAINQQTQASSDQLKQSEQQAKATMSDSIKTIRSGMSSSGAPQGALENVDGMPSTPPLPSTRVIPTILK